MRLNYLMLIAAICLSCVAAYYSIVGMTSIFNGAILAIVIMTGILEISKLIVTSWLYNNWSNTHKILRSYLTIAVIVLMFITNIGIFGFLSKANIEQSALAEEQLAQITRIDQQIADQKTLISEIRDQISNQNSTELSGASAINARIADVTRVIDSINKRAQILIDEQKAILDQERSKIDIKIAAYQKQIDDIDHQFSTMSLRQQKAHQSQINNQRSDLNKKIDIIKNAPNSIVDSANAEIAKIRSHSEEETRQSQITINTLTAKLTQGVDVDNLQAAVDQQNARVKLAMNQIDLLTTAKFKLQGESRKLDVEVGPLKYIAQLIYGDNVDQKLLEHAVRIVILILILVFDPLALAMLIAANQGLLAYRKQEVIIKDPKIIETVSTAPNPVQDEIISTSMANQELTTIPTPVIVDINEQPDDIIPVAPIIPEYNSNGVIQTTEDLIETLRNAHSERINSVKS